MDLFYSNIFDFINIAINFYILI